MIKVVVMMVIVVIQMIVDPKADAISDGNGEQ